MYDFKKIEGEILRFWKDKKIYEKVKEKNKKGKKFYMMDGPPYATGSIHMGTALNKILKDIAMRSHRLQGFDVFDRAGYDTHGVPIEFQIEKEIGSRSKQDIEKFGVKKFIKKCKEFATKYIDVMNSEFENLGVWMDFKKPYLTLSEGYIEKIWDTFKEADKKRLLYLGKYPVHVCPRCETAVAYNEIEYAKQEDVSIFVKFPLKNKKNTFLIIWTTTPWTLPGNTGIMANPDFIYQEIELSNGERWILAKELVPKIMKELGLGYTSKTEYPGKSMEGWQYENPLSKYLKLKLRNAYKILLSARYVNLEEGTGLVHSAPGHGKEDYEVGKEYGSDMPSPVDINGMMTEEAGKYAGKKARIVDSEIISDLEKDGFLVYKLKYIHDYPLCWRCKSALLMISQPQWFLKISDIQKKLLKENENVNWVPSWMELRMKAWLEGIGDWPVSRKRYWGTPLPIWICECGKKIVIGSKKELEKLAGRKVRELHKPEIDLVEIPCKCGKYMKRVPEVLDVWFDSGVSSWAAVDEREFKKYWPADLNIEGKDQIRGWWNSQFILSEIKFGKKPFESISVHGMVLDISKRKMSKSLGNFLSPHEIINKYGRDYLRYYFAKVSKGEDFSFDEAEFKEIDKTIRVLLNVNNYVCQLGKYKKAKNLGVEDKWILSRLNSLIKEVLKNYNSYLFYKAVESLEKFLIYDLSRTYIQMIRERSEEDSAKQTLSEVMDKLILLFAPITPFLCEKIYSGHGRENSIFLERIEESEDKKIDKKLEKDFETAMKIIEAGLAARDKEKIGLKWPLAKATIFSEEKIEKEIQEVIMKQLNVKKIEVKSGELKVELDTRLTEELEAEGFAREIARKVQAERKNAGLVKKDKIKLLLVTSKRLKNLLGSQTSLIKERTNSKKLDIVEKIEKKYKIGKKFEIKDEKVSIMFEKI